MHTGTGVHAHRHKLAHVDMHMGTGMHTGRGMYTGTGMHKVTHTGMHTRACTQKQAGVLTEMGMLTGTHGQVCTQENVEVCTAIIMK